MTGNLLGISVTGLRAAQASLNTVGHNISNSGVDGYSRQRVDLLTNPATLQGNSFIGNGVTVSSVERIANQFIDEQLRVDTTLFKDLEVFEDNISQLDTLLSDSATGLSGSLEQFFSAMQNGANDPTSIPARQLIISQADNLADRFNTIHGRFEQLADNISSGMSGVVSEINALAKSIGNLNLQISNTAGSGGAPNDLLDQRGRAVKRLSELIGVQTFDSGAGQLNVIVGRGESLVVGTDVRQLGLVPSDTDASKAELVVIGDQGNKVITDLVSGGELGGLIRFRETSLSKTFNEFGRLAVVMADTLNVVHKQGINLNEEFGSNFFSDVNDTQVSRSRVKGSSENAPPADRILSLNIENSEALVASDYELQVESGGLYRIQRLSDGEEVSVGILSGAFPTSVEFDGLSLKFEGGSFQSGDKFVLQPFRAAARDFSSALISPQDIAFGSPLLTDASLGNVGSGAISQGEVLSLDDQFGEPLPLLATSGQMSPPMLVRFTSDTTYEVLDNTDQGNPKQLEPPLRDQRYVIGALNPIFGTDPGETLVTTRGDMIGLPEGRRATQNAALQFDTPPANPPAFGVDFTNTANQFSFEIEVTNTAGGANNGTFTVVIDSAVTDNDRLIREINTQISLTDARAYIADNGTLAFRLNTPGFGDVAVQNYNNDPDGGGDFAPVGQANNLLGFTIEAGATFTTVGGQDGVSGDGFTTNGYPAEVITLTSTQDDGSEITQNLFTDLNASMAQTASMLDNVQGVSANAFNYMEISNFQVSRQEPLQLNLNGEDLLQYSLDSVTGAPELGSGVPDPVSEFNEFLDYVATRINDNPTLSLQGIHAVGGVDPVTGRSELRIYESEGNDLSMAFTAAVGESVDVSDGDNTNLALEGNGNSVSALANIGGRMDVTLADGLVLGTFPPNSMLFGNTEAVDFSLSTYLGIQAEIEGTPRIGDTFTLDFNRNSSSDNRNALLMADLADAGTLEDGTVSYSEGYASLVEEVGIDTASAKINLDASEQVLEQSIERRNSISGVNLDEEAANLIKFEQLYQANAQVINVARDLFDRLLNSF